MPQAYFRQAVQAYIRAYMQRKIEVRRERADARKYVLPARFFSAARYARDMS